MLFDILFFMLPIGILVTALVLVLSNDKNAVKLAKEVKNILHKIDISETTTRQQLQLFSRHLSENNDKQQALDGLVGKHMEDFSALERVVYCCTEDVETMKRTVARITSTTNNQIVLSHRVLDMVNMFQKSIKKPEGKKCGKKSKSS